MLSHERMLSVLDLFDLEHPEWTFDTMYARLGFSRSTLYRYLKTLTDAGFLTTFPGRGYTLGPRVIELDYQIMTTDPLIHVARPVMNELVTGYSCISLLCRRYKQKVLCVHQETSTSQFRSTYERGKARPLLLGAASLAILAYFSTYQLTKLFEEQGEEFRAAGLGDTLPAVRETLKRIRQKGWVHTEGQVTSGVTGVAAPIFDAKEEIIGSLSLTLPETGLANDKVDGIGERVQFCARIISKSLE
ncbi:IclR family transcriptional regulator [Pelagibacterium luteolum]|uniref:Transcriptional regulator, IclR family n=1 Tax=Pelagibacterium luteolum TaxID=440168 RepID=A0A1G7SWV7_9HYPH|nr:IclR family transcriptional regulator [Pelagibacterium luteolum]SDG27545.1 transcriptional regulator, IclR family [Pelagibacterium luteolum]